MAWLPHNQKSVFTQIETTWYVPGQFWTWVAKRATMLFSNVPEQVARSCCSFYFSLRYGKTGNKKRATCLAKLLQNELNSDNARYTTHIKVVLQKIRLWTGLNVSGKTRNIAIQLVLQQYCKTNCTCFVARFSVPLRSLDGHGGANFA